MSQVDDSEVLARYIFSKNQYKPSDSTVKYNVFMPPTGNKRLSVFRVSNLPENRIWEIGRRLRELPLLARADIKTLSVIETGLSINADDNPEHHANIIGWPAEQSEIKLKAIELAEKASLYLNESE